MKPKTPSKQGGVGNSKPMPERQTPQKTRSHPTGQPNTPATSRGASNKRRD